MHTCVAHVPQKRFTKRFITVLFEVAPIETVQIFISSGMNSVLYSYTVIPYSSESEESTS